MAKRVRTGTTRISVASCKAKARNLQKVVRDKILEAFPTLSVDDVRSTGMGQQGADVQLSKVAKDVFPYEVECKSLARVAVYNYYAQAKSHGSLEPLVVVKQNGSKPLVIVGLDHFMELIKNA
jgi:hypothetical protein